MLVLPQYYLNLMKSKLPWRVGMHVGHLHGGRKREYAVVISFFGRARGALNDASRRVLVERGLTRSVCPSFCLSASSSRSSLLIKVLSALICVALAGRPRLLQFNPWHSAPSAAIPRMWATVARCRKHRYTLSGSRAPTRRRRV